MPPDPRKYMRIYRDLSERIADGRLPSGTLLNLGTLADDYDAARETVQHAVRLLADDGKVVRYPGIGWQVQ
jgi:DNA-binding GntR family transcriptional regulator